MILRIMTMHWDAQVRHTDLEHTEPPWFHVNADVIANTEAYAIEGATFVYNMFCARRVHYVREMPHCRGTFKVATKERFRGYARFSYCLQPGERVVEHHELPSLSLNDI